MLKGLISQLFRRRLHRQRFTEQHSPENRSKMKALKQNLQLCYLQLSQAIPIVVDRLLVFSKHFLYPDVEFHNKTDEFLNKFYMAIFQDYTDLDFNFAHSSHFYLYVLFSKSFRKGFRKRVLKRARYVMKAVSGGGTTTVTGFRAQAVSKG